MPDRRKHFVAVGVEWHHAQIEAGPFGIFGRIAIVRRRLAADEIARRFRPELTRVVGNERAVDAAAE